MCRNEREGRREEEIVFLNEPKAELPDRGMLYWEDQVIVA